MPDPRPGPARRRPPGTLRVGSVGGTEILVSYTTLFFAALFAVILGPQVEAVRPGLGPLRYLAGAVFAVLLYLAVLLHEASHAIVARRFGDVVPSITLHFLGGMTAVQGEARTPRQEFLVAVVGPLTSLAVGGVAYLASVRVEPGLVALALFGLHTLSPAAAFGGAAAFVVVILITIGLLRWRIGVALGWLVQLALIALGILNPVMYVVGVGFTAFWVWCFVRARQIDAKRREFMLAHPEFADPVAEPTTPTTEVEGDTP